MKVALVYDRVNKWGGAERVLLALHKIFPNAPLYTSVYNPRTAGWAKVFKVKSSFLQKFPWASSSHEFYSALMPLAFESFSFDEFDLVISITSEAAKGIITKPHTLHVCYCLTPTRYLWSGYEEYFKHPLFRVISKPPVSYLRKWDLKASLRPDAFLAISEEVKRRIKKYYNHDSSVIYPPIGLEEEKSLPFLLNILPFFLIVSRLVSYKRIDIAIQACNVLKLPLVIVGTGYDEKRLKKMSGPTITFVGNLTDSELLGYYKSCRAFIFPGNEDFGLTILEAQLFGKSVIAFRGGGALETVNEGKTGLFFYPQTAQALIKALCIFEKVKFKEQDSLNQARKFSFIIFKEQFMKHINIFLNNSKIK